MPHYVKGIRILESGKLLLVESGIVGFGIRNTALGIRNPTMIGIRRIQVPLSKVGIHNWNSESTAWNLESKTVLDFLS